MIADTMLGVGFGLCAVSVDRALESTDLAWVAERIDRDPLYLLALFAAINRLEYFVWGIAFGTYGFAFAIWWFTRRAGRDALPGALAQSVTAGATASTPMLAELIVCFVCSPRQREEVLGHLEEEFRTHVAAQGWARCWYYWHTLSLVWAKVSKLTRVEKLRM